MKALVLSHSSELAGAELSLIELFDDWTKKNLIDPYFIIRRPTGTMAKELRQRGWNYIALYYNGWANRHPYDQRRAEDIYRNALFNSRAVFKIEQLIKELKPDLVMTNTIISPWAAIAAYFQQIPHIWFVREYGDVEHRHNFECGLEGMFQDIDTLSNLVVTNSKTLATHTEKFINRGKIVPLYTPFNLNLLKKKSIQPAKNPFKDPQSLKLVITGRISPSKGQADAAAAVAELKKRGFKAELCIIGAAYEPADSAPLQAIIDEHNLSDRIHLIGQKKNPLSTVRYADVGIMASRGEAFGRVTFEYMALGLPVVGARSGATPEIVENRKQGYLYELGNVDSLTDQLMKYAKNRRLLRTHGSNALAKSKQMMDSEYSADALFTKIQELVRQREQVVSTPLNHAHRWLEYPLVSAQYIEDSGVISFRHLIYQRMRHRAKWAFFTIGRTYRFVRRGFKRSSSAKRRS